MCPKSVRMTSSRRARWCASACASVWVDATAMCRASTRGSESCSSRRQFARSLDTCCVLSGRRPPWNARRTARMTRAKHPLGRRRGYWQPGAAGFWRWRTVAFGGGRARTDFSLGFNPGSGFAAKFASSSYVGRRRTRGAPRCIIAIAIAPPSPIEIPHKRRRSAPIAISG